jgi:hypothetical protein
MWTRYWPDSASDTKWISAKNLRNNLLVSAYLLECQSNNLACSCRSIAPQFCGASLVASCSQCQPWQLHRFQLGLDCAHHYREQREYDNENLQPLLQANMSRSMSSFVRSMVLDGVMLLIRRRCTSAVPTLFSGSTTVPCMCSLAHCRHGRDPALHARHYYLTSALTCRRSRNHTPDIKSFV